MTRTISFQPILLTACLLVFAGCRNNTTSDPAAPQATQKVAEDPTRNALDLFRQGGDRVLLRDATSLLNPALGKPENVARLVLSADERKFLEVLKLAPAEVQFLEAMHFQPIDAVALESAALFRDAARTLEIPGLSPEMQAAFAFEWTRRHVLFYQQRLEGLPPAYVLRAGHGSATDRGLVFLAIAHQLKLDGCLLALPDAAEAPLVGVAVADKLLLFDTRLGLPVKGPGGIATWKEVVDDPKLLADSKITPEQIKSLEARIAAPLELLSPRMRYLESLLQGDEAYIASDRLRTHVDVVKTAKAIEAAGMSKIGFWIPALRIDRQFASVDDGGLDASQRALRFSSQLIPWPPVLKRYQELRILSELPQAARVNLINVTAQLFDRYYLQPGEMLARGKSDALPRRLERIRGVLDDAEFSSDRDDRELTKLAAAWRDRVNKAYLAMQREADGAAKVQELWEEDIYLTYLIHQPDLEDIPRNIPKKTLSRLILAASRQPLAARANWLFASLSQDKAERLQAAWSVQKSAGQETKTAAMNVRNAWLNTRSAWNQYLDRNNLGPGIYATSLPKIRIAFEQGEWDFGLNEWEYLQHEVHRYVAARLGQAKAMRETGQDPGPLLEQLDRELDQLINDPNIAKARAAVPVASLARVPEFARRWSLLSRDWGPDGAYAWLRETVRLVQPK